MTELQFSQLASPASRSDQVRAPIGHGNGPPRASGTRLAFQFRHPFVAARKVKGACATEDRPSARKSRAFAAHA